MTLSEIYEAARSGQELRWNGRRAFIWRLEVTGSLEAPLKAAELPDGQVRTLIAKPGELSQA